MQACDIAFVGLSWSLEDASFAILESRHGACQISKLAL